MNTETIAAIILGSLLKTWAAEEIVSMVDSKDCSISGKRAFWVVVRGQTLKEIEENRARVRDAARALGVGVAKLKVSAYNNGTVYYVGAIMRPGIYAHSRDFSHYEARFAVSYKN